MIVNKVTTGFVVQRFDTKTRKFLSQEFIASDECAFEDDDGDKVDTFTEYLTYEMVQTEALEDQIESM